MEKKNGNGNGKGKIEVKEAKIRYENITAGQLPEEYVVTFRTAKGLARAILQSYYINQSNKTIKVVIVGQDRDRYLVDLPAYIFNAGSKAWFSKEAVLV
ncbi:MAG: hypothetical protein WB588_05135 [Dehalococcoidia bacterium]